MEGMQSDGSNASWDGTLQNRLDDPLNKLQADFLGDRFNRAAQRDLLEDPFNGIEIPRTQPSFGGDRPSSTQADLLKDPFSRTQMDPLGGDFPKTQTDRSEDSFAQMLQRSLDDLDHNRQQALLDDPLKEVCRWIGSAQI